MENTRNSLYDNAKVLLMFLVVFGHFIEQFIWTNSAMKVLYTFIYFFHMPAFIFISGYFSNTVISVKECKKLANKFLIPYILSQLAFLLFIKLIGIENNEYTIITPLYIYWYLFAMFVWNIIVKIIGLLKIDVKYLIPISFIFGVLAGYVDSFGRVLSISRIIVFLPYFLLGYYFKTNKIEVKSILKRKWIAILILVLAVVLAILLINESSMWLLCNLPYKDLGVTGGLAAIYRIVVYLLQIVTTISFFKLVPKKKNKITKIGTNTLYIYVLHGFIVKYFVSRGFYNEFSLSKLIMVILLSVAIVYLFGNLRFKNYIKNHNINKSQEASVNY